MNNLQSNKFFGSWLLINDEVYITNYKISIIDIISYFSAFNFSYATEYNLKIISEKEQEEKKIKNLDKIELVTIVGGG